MRRRAFLAAAFASLTAPALAARSRIAERFTPGITTMIMVHDRIRRRLRPADRSLLASLSSKLAATHPRGRFPDDAHAALAVAARGLGADEVSVLADYASTELFEATRRMQETQMSFNLQYLQLQSSMQNENRQYTAVSNILKAKHDTVKNSIGNIR